MEGIEFPDDPRQQLITLKGPGNMTMEIPLPAIDEVFKTALCSAINYAAQIGACFAMLLVVLTMTAKNRFGRTPTVINTANLVVTVIRCTLLVLFFTSSYLEMYTFFSEDGTYVSPNDTRISIAATVFAIPQMALVETALIVQAWAMIRLWPRQFKWVAVVASGAVAVATFGFKCASVSFQIRIIREVFDIEPLLWIRQTDLALTTAMIVWFCFLFNARLVLHMWKHRSILPTVKGLSPMEVLVTANGMLMLIPVIFTGVQFGNFGNFEAASLVSTSVVLVLPLGTLVAQRLAQGAVSTQNSHDTDNGTMNSKKHFLGGYSHHSTGTGISSRSRSFPVPKLTTKVHGNAPKP